MNKLRYIPLDNVYRIDCLKMMKRLPDNSVSAIVCDPPYELGFMGKKWDSTGIAYNVDVWKEALRILKPGGYLISFSGTRTYHRMASAIEDAGFNIKDMIQFVYNTGFPKNYDIGKAITAKETTGKSNPKALRETRMKDDYKPTGQKDYKKGRMFSSEIEKDTRETQLTDNAKRFEGYGTALKPSFEPMVLAQKPLEGNYVQNVLKWGTGGLNIGACKMEHDDPVKFGKRNTAKFQGDVMGVWEEENKENVLLSVSAEGRYPANTITTDPDSEVIESKFFNIVPKSVQKKASKKDRNSKYNGEPMNGEKKKTNDGRKKEADNAYQRGQTERLNHHPTVKNTYLMEHLLKLVLPPIDEDNPAIIFDPFSGSGSTLVAAKRLKTSNEKYEHLYFLGSELEKEYINIIRERLKD